MGQLTIISETGMFHSACRIDVGRTSGWLGFQPRTHRAPIGPGLVDTSDRSAFINHEITFQIPDPILMAASSAVTSQFGTATYILGVRDCVSLSAEVARQVGLRVPAVNMTPYGLILILAAANTYVSWR